MRVTLLKKNPHVYSCNAYLVRGDWNAIDNVNTLIDTGVDDFILQELDTISTGVGKRRVEQVVITHEHFDHLGGLKHIVSKYNPRVYAFKNNPGISKVLHDTMRVPFGETKAQIFHTPGHSHDSICIYCEKEKSLFTGDTQLIINSTGGTYSSQFLEALIRLSKLKIETIYPGHDSPQSGNITDKIKRSIDYVKKSKII